MKTMIQYTLTTYYDCTALILQPAYNVNFAEKVAVATSGQTLSQQ